jgi:glyoxylase-like metal-dependent hydrolase (beta-lactamase superfamily II)
MIIESKAVPPFLKNGFVLADGGTRDAVLIDPGDEVRDLLAFVERQALRVHHILLTHAHVDHVSGVAEARRALGVPIALHRDDLFLYERAVEIGRMFGLEIEAPPPVDEFYAPDSLFRVGTLEIRPHHTPGHCPGGVCLAVNTAGTPPRTLFVGDTLFAGSIGRTDLPGGDFDTLIGSITRVLFPFGDDAVVYSGHGPVTTIGEERRTNPFLRDVRGHA